MRYGYVNRTAVGLLVLAALLAGCAPTRSEYFGQLRQSRVDAYQRWLTGRDRDKSPRLEGKMDLDSAVATALQHNTELLAVLQEKERARGIVVEAYSELLPRLDVNAGYTRLNAPLVPGGAKDMYSYSFLVTQPLFKGRAFIAQRAARLATYLGDETVRGTVENVVLQVAQSYFDSLLAEHLVSVQESALESALAQLRAATEKKEQGVATEYEVLRARVEVSNIQAELIQQRSARDLARTRLYRGMGVGQESQLDLTTTLEYVPGAPGFEEAVRLAFVNRPDIYLACLNVDAQKEMVRDVYTRYLPTAEATYMRLWGRPDPDNPAQDRWAEDWQAGIGINWTAFDGLAREGQVIQQQAVLRQKELLLADTEQQAIQDVQAALLEMRNAQELVDSQQLNRERAKKALELVEEGYRVGVNTEVEVLDGRSALTTAVGLYYRALHRHTIARVNLQKAIGLLGPGPGTEEVPKSLPSPGDVKAALQKAQENEKGGQVPAPAAPAAPTPSDAGVEQK